MICITFEEYTNFTAKCDIQMRDKCLNALLVVINMYKAFNTHLRYHQVVSLQMENVPTSTFHV